jgi:hypothetical protein
MSRVVTALLSQFTDFGNPHHEVGLGSLYATHIDSPFYNVFDFTVLAVGMEVSVKEAIKLKTLKSPSDLTTLSSIHLQDKYY